MFTGIIEEVGRVRSIRKNSRSGVLCIDGAIVLEGTKIGDSIAVNGVCLTVTTLDSNGFTADVMGETLDRSTLGSLRAGSLVNLERAMAADGRFGGHFVSGHIDGTGSISMKKKDQQAVWYTVRCGPALLRYIIEKGSIAIDGISLTVAKVTGNDFSVSVIPHTGAQTILSQKQIGDQVNIENDSIAKYVEKLMAGQARDKPLTMESLL